MSTTKGKENTKPIATNRKAYHNYEIVDSYEAGMVLTGSEVKSLREGRANLSDAYATVNKGEIFLRNLHISPYENGGYANHDPLRERKVLLHRQEIRKLISKVSEKGYTLIPLKLYFKTGLAKVLIGLAKGKRQVDRSKDIKERDMKRDLDRQVKDRSV
jgi:SsrA-binding protein